MLYFVNNFCYKDCYCVMGVDQCFVEVLDRLILDIVYIGHFNYFLTLLVREVVLCEIFVVYMLYDYWLMCFCGQFM